MEKAVGQLVADIPIIEVRKISQQYEKAKGEAILKMHKAGVAHNDLHNGNLFYDLKTNTVTIIDFGLGDKTAYSKFMDYQDIASYIYAETGQSFETAEAYTKFLKF